MTDIGMRAIRPPFANYSRAELERMVIRGFEEVELRAAEKLRRSGFDGPSGTPISPFEFQILVAADAYLRATKDAGGQDQ